MFTQLLNVCRLADVNESNVDANVTKTIAIATTAEEKTNLKILFQSLLKISKL